MNSVLVITSHDRDGLSPMTRELAAAATACGGSESAFDLLAVPDMEPGQINAVISQLLAVDPRPQTLILAHGGQMRDLAPRLALALDGGYAAGVTGFQRDQRGRGWWYRPVDNNEQVQPVSGLDSHPLVVTVTPGSFPQCKFPLPPVRYLELPPPAHPGISCIQRTRKGTPGRGLAHARVVVAVGRGMGEPENLDLVRQMVAAIPGAALGASRPLVDQGLLPYHHQVGITGARVSPELYLALGISGSTQHLAGMASSRTIIAVNHSPDCPLFRHADICILGDVPAFIRAFLDLGAPGAEEGSL